MEVEIEQLRVADVRQGGELQLLCGLSSPFRSEAVALYKEANIHPSFTRFVSGEFLPQRCLSHASCQFLFYLALGKTGLAEVGTDPDIAVQTPQ